MKYFFYFLLFLFFQACEPEPYEHEKSFIVENTTNYTIKTTFYSELPSNYFPESFELSLIKSKKYSSSEVGAFPEWFPFEAIDSIRVIFNDDISVVHGSSLYDVNRSLLLETSFIQTKDEEFLREFNYIFTEEDYQEALLHQ